MVLFIMVDGARPDALTQAHCPNIARLIAEGASTMQAQSVMPSITLPCHMSIFHSVPPTRHGITSNVYTPMARPLPGLVEAARAAGKRTAFIYNWEPLRDLARPEQISYAHYYEPPLDPSYDDQIAVQAAPIIASARYDFVFVYLGSVDTAGHAYGWMAPEYLAQLERADARVGDLLAAASGDTTVILQADHGGHDRGHGTEIAEDMTIPWVISGPGVRRGYTIQSAVSLLDTAPTIARVLGITAPREWEGQAVSEAFED